MLCTDLSTGIWLMVATYLELPVSTTHSTIGGIVGFSLVNGGRHGVKWSDPVPGFPYVEGLVPIVISWFVSPALSAAFSGTMASLARGLVVGEPQGIHGSEMRGANWVVRARGKIYESI